MTSSPAKIRIVPICNPLTQVHVKAEAEGCGSADEEAVPMDDEHHFGGVSIPALNPWPGIYGFDVVVLGPRLIKDCSKSPVYMWSHSLEKLFVEMNKACPFSVILELFPRSEKLYLRATPVYAQSCHIQTVVRRCPHHQAADEAANLDLSLVQHILRAEHANADYSENAADGRLSMRMPLEAPEPGSTSTTVLLKFSCLNSCAGGISRRQLVILFTLERENGEVLGRKSIEVRVCACPKRDKAKEEERRQLGLSSSTGGNVSRGRRASASGSDDAGMKVPMDDPLYPPPAHCNEASPRLPAARLCWRPLPVRGGTGLPPFKRKSFSDSSTGSTSEPSTAGDTQTKGSSHHIMQALQRFVDLEAFLETRHPDILREFETTYAQQDAGYSSSSPDDLSPEFLPSSAAASARLSIPGCSASKPHPPVFRRSFSVDSASSPPHSMDESDAEQAPEGTGIRSRPKEPRLCSMASSLPDQLVASPGSPAGLLQHFLFSAPTAPRKKHSVLIAGRFQRSAPENDSLSSSQPMNLSLGPVAVSPPPPTSKPRPSPESPPPDSSCVTEGSALTESERTHTVGSFFQLILSECVRLSSVLGSCGCQTTAPLSSVDVTQLCSLSTNHSVSFQLVSMLRHAVEEAKRLSHAETLAQLANGIPKLEKHSA